MSKISPNNRCEILVNDFIGLATAHLLTVEGTAVCTTTYSNGLILPGFANWKGYTCEPASPSAPTTLPDAIPTQFQGIKDLTLVEIEYFKEDLQQIYAENYPTEVLNAPIYGGKTINTANTANTSYIASGTEARTVAEQYLGRTMSDEEWNNLVAVTFAEAGRNQEEEAWVAATILNRVRLKYTPRGIGNSSYNFNTVTDIIWQWRQYEAVTGNPTNGNQPSRNFLQGPNRTSEISIYGAIKNFIKQVPTTYTDFTSNNDCLYVECNSPRSGINDVKYANGKPIRIAGRDYNYLLNMKKKAGTIVKGSSIFGRN